MRLRIRIVLAAIALVVSVVLWLQFRPDSAAAQQATQEQAASVPPEHQRPGTARSLALPQLPRTSTTDAEEAIQYKKHRLARVSDIFDRWVRRYRISPDQEIKVLRVLADAQRVFDETGDIRDQLWDEASKKRDARMTTEQRQTWEAAAKRYTQTMRGPNNDERTAASLAFSDVEGKIADDLAASAPDDEQALFETALQVERDLDAQVRASLAEFLTPTQVEALTSPSFFLRAGNVVYLDEQYAKTLAERRR